MTGDIPFSPGTVGVSASLGSIGDMFQGFPGDPDTGSRGSSSPSLESQYLSSVESFGSPPTTSAPQVSPHYLIHFTAVSVRTHTCLSKQHDSSSACFCVKTEAAKPFCSFRACLDVYSENIILTSQHARRIRPVATW